MKKKGFTLVELMIVVIIIGVLASTAAPMMRSLAMKATATEALATLGVIWTCEREFYLENNHYANGSELVEQGYFKETDLNGTYLSKYCYLRTFIAVAVTKTIFIFCQPCYSDPAEAVKANEVNRNWVGVPIVGGSYIAMDNYGNIYSNIEGLGYPAIADLVIS